MFNSDSQQRSVSIAFEEVNVESPNDKLKGSNRELNFEHLTEALKESLDELTMMEVSAAHVFY